MGSLITGGRKVNDDDARDLAHLGGDRDFDSRHPCLGGDLSQPGGPYRHPILRRQHHRRAGQHPRRETCRRVEAAGHRREPARSSGHHRGRQERTRWLHADADLEWPHDCRAINKSIQFDPVKDFAGVSRVAAVPLVAIVPPDLPAKTLSDFITLAKERPGQLNFSSAGVASTSYLSAEIFKQDAKINILHIPYKGAPEATTAVIRNDAQMYFAPIPATQELSATGKVRAIAI